MFNFFNKFNSYKTTNSNNRSLTILNGLILSKSMPLNNILINGNVSIGKESEEIIIPNILHSNSQ